MGLFCFHREKLAQELAFEGVFISGYPVLLKSKAHSLDQLQVGLRKRITLPIEKEEGMNTRCTVKDSLLKAKNSKKV